MRDVQNDVIHPECSVHMHRTPYKRRCSGHHKEYLVWERRILMAHQWLSKLLIEAGNIYKSTWEKGLCLCTTKDLENILILPNEHLFILKTPDHVDSCKARVDGHVLHKPGQITTSEWTLNLVEVPPVNMADLVIYCVIHGRLRENAFSCNNFGNQPIPGVRRGFMVIIPERRFTIWHLYHSRHFYSFLHWWVWSKDSMSHFTNILL